MKKFIVLLLLLATPAYGLNWEDNKPDGDDTGSAGFLKTQDNFSWLRALIDNIASGHTDTNVDSVSLTQSHTSYASVATLPAGENDDVAIVRDIKALYLHEGGVWSNSASGGASGVTGLLTTNTPTSAGGTITQTGANGITITTNQISTSPENWIFTIKNDATSAAGLTMKTITSTGTISASNNIYANDRRVLESQLQSDFRINDFSVTDASPPDVSFQNLGSSDVFVRVLDFAAGEYAINDFTVPDHISETFLQVETQFSESTTGSGTAIFRLNFIPVGVGEDADGIRGGAVTKTATFASNSTAYHRKLVFQLTGTSVGDRVYLTLNRIGGTYANDARLWGIRGYGNSKNSSNQYLGD